MNKKNYKLKNISAVELSHMEFPLGETGIVGRISSQIILEDGGIKKIAEIATKLGSGSVFLLAQAGLENFATQVEKVLCEESVSLFLLDSNADFSAVGQMEVRKSLPSKTKLIVAVGGGGVCDFSKQIAVSSTLPLCFVPTAPSADGLLSDFSMLEVGGELQLVKTKSPEYVVCDPELCENVPPKMFRSGFGDVASNYLAVFDWMVAKDFGMKEFYPELASLSISAADCAVSAGVEYLSNKKRGVALLFEGLLKSSACMVLYGGFAPACGAEHSVAIALSRMGVNFSHGDGVFYCFCKLVEIYGLFFSLHSSGKYLPPDTQLRCDMLMEKLGYSEVFAEHICALPLANDEYKIFKEKYRICRRKYSEDIKKLSAKLPQLKMLYFKIFGEDVESFNVEAEKITMAIALAPEVENKFSTLNLMREFGLLDGLIVT